VEGFNLARHVCGGRVDFFGRSLGGELGQLADHRRAFRVQNCTDFH
jgi:hypothetical protein